MIGSKLSVIDSFCGFEGLSYGFFQAGYEDVLGIDHWQDAIKIFEYNNKGSKGLVAELFNQTSNEISKKTGFKKPDIIIGGPPCQSFSISGKRIIDDERNIFYKSFVSFVEFYKPQVFLMDFLPSIVSMGNGIVKDNIIKDFENFGYKVVYKMLLASEFGVPQNRRSAFFIEINVKKFFNFPEIKNPEFVSSTEVISDLPEKSITDAAKYPLKGNSEFQADKFNKQKEITNSEITVIEENWFAFVNQFDGIEAFAPHLDQSEQESISALIQEYYSRMTGYNKVSTKIVGDYGKSVILAYKYLRTKNKTYRQYLFNKIPTPLGVGYDIQCVEVEKKKRYIEVKNTKSRKAITKNRFKLTPNEWGTAETIGENYFIYYQVVNENSKNFFVIQNPVKQYEQGNLKIDKNLVVQFSKTSGQWEKLLEI